MTRPKITYTGSAGNYTALRGGTSCEVGVTWNGLWQARVLGEFIATRPTRHAAAAAALDWRDEQDRLRMARIEKEEGR